ncbi:hypothetical protein [Streptomyces sp. NPDC059134]|uniref:MmyB family transcriptional regulator n=1 Tax=Streptomyces sp. NPDC059134 TaxID=3346738 RepID=UPI00367E50C9
MPSAVAADPTHPRATAVVGELSIHSADRRLWTRHDVRVPVSGTKTFRGRRSATSSWTGTSVRRPAGRTR